MDPSSSSLIQDLPDELQPSRVQRSTLFNQPTHVGVIKGCESAFVSFMLIALSIRLYVRAVITKRWRWDDYTCILAACGSVAHMIITLQLKMASGRQWYDILAGSNARIWFANSIVYPWTVAFARISILLLFQRTFSSVKRIHYLVRGAIFFQVLFYTGIQFVGVAWFVKCYGLEQDTSSFCRDVGHILDIFFDTLNLLSDSWPTFLPLTLLTSTQSGFYRRVGVFIWQLCGMAVFGANMWRQDQTHAGEGSPDWLWACTIVQINGLIIFVCASTFPAFFSHLFSSRFTSKLQSGNTTDSPRSRSNSVYNLHGGEIVEKSDDIAARLKEAMEAEEAEEAETEMRDGKGKMSDYNYNTFAMSAPVSLPTSMSMIEQTKQGNEVEKVKETV